MSTKATHVVSVVTNTAQPQVRAIELELAEVCRKHDGDMDRACALLTALVLTSVSACKSFGIHPADFIRQFEAVYNDTPAPAVIPVLEERQS